MTRISYNELLDAGVHFGHLKRKWNPAMAPYIFMERNGIHIIDLHKTVVKIEEASAGLKWPIIFSSFFLVQYRYKGENGKSNCHSRLKSVSFTRLFL